MTTIKRIALMMTMMMALMMLLSIGGSRAGSPDLNLFQTLYDRVLETVVPGYNPLGNAPPSQVILFEMPGIAINRQEYDDSAWTAGGYVASQPDAMVARLVDRATYYTGPTFVDSGATISGLWKSLLYQYVVPIIDNPIQEAKAEKARAALANDTLSNIYNSKLDVYAATLAQFSSSRDDCLLKQAASICSRNLVVWNERLRRAWFSLEVARRELEGAEARLLALQVQDLTSTFADALETYATAERVDVGAAGAGLTYYYTSLTPSTWWQWWPQNVGTWDFTATYPTPLSFNYTKPNAAIALQPSRGSVVMTGSLVVYTPFAGSGFDRIGFSYSDAITNLTRISYVTINVIGNDALAADSAFVSLVISSSQAQSSTTSSSIFGQAFQSSSDTSVSSSASFNWWSYSGSSATASSSSASAISSYSTSASFSGSSSDVSISFSVARVNINRPWLDTSLLSYYPVAIRGVGKNAWSDGSTQPSPRVLQTFKLLPVAFIVARNIVISSSSWGATYSITQSASSQASQSSSSSSSARVSIGPFFAGSSSTGAGAASSSGRSYQERSSFKSDASVTSTGGALSIQGPQIIAWACAPVPAFPSASEDEVSSFEQLQLQKARAALALYPTTPTAPAQPTPTQPTPAQPAPAQPPAQPTPFTSPVQPPTQSPPSQQPAPVPAPVQPPTPPASPVATPTPTPKPAPAPQAPPTPSAPSAPKPVPAP